MQRVVRRGAYRHQELEYRISLFGHEFHKASYSFYITYYNDDNDGLINTKKVHYIEILLESTKMSGFICGKSYF